MEPPRCARETWTRKQGKWLVFIYKHRLKETFLNSFKKSDLAPKHANSKCYMKS